MTLVQCCRWGGKRLPALGHSPLPLQANGDKPPLHLLHDVEHVHAMVTYIILLTAIFCLKLSENHKRRTIRLLRGGGDGWKILKKNILQAKKHEYICVESLKNISCRYEGV